MPTLRPRKPQSGAPAPDPSFPSPSETAASSAVPTSAARHRKTQPATPASENEEGEMAPSPDERAPLLPVAGQLLPSAQPSETLSWMQRNQWILFALASGACAAFNGVFAKL
jgi:hypothetical protein